MNPVGDLGEGPMGPVPPPLILGKTATKKEITEERKAGRASKTKLK